MQLLDAIHMLSVSLILSFSALNTNLKKKKNCSNIRCCIHIPASRHRLLCTTAGLVTDLTCGHYYLLSSVNSPFVSVTIDQRLNQKKHLLQFFLYVINKKQTEIIQFLETQNCEILNCYYYQTEFCIFPITVIFVL